MANVVIPALDKLSNRALTWQGQGNINNLGESKAPLSNRAAFVRSFPLRRPGTLANFSGEFR